MTATAPPTVKDQDLISSGLVESASVNSFADFIPSKLNEHELITEQEKNEFVNLIPQFCRIQKHVELNLHYFWNSSKFNSTFFAKYK